MQNKYLSHLIQSHIKIWDMVRVTDSWSMLAGEANLHQLPSGSQTGPPELKITYQKQVEHPWTIANDKIGEKKQEEEERWTEKQKQTKPYSLMKYCPPSEKLPTEVANLYQFKNYQ
jgi:hypothetical protein